MTIDPGNERRKFVRSKIRVPIEFRTNEATVSSRTATSDLSMGGFYLETMFTMPVGTELEVTLHLDNPVLALATVATCDPSFGNGVHFTKILPEDEEVLRRYIEAQEQAAKADEQSESEPSA